MAFDGSPEVPFTNAHDFAAAQRRLIEAQRSVSRSTIQPGLFGDEIAVDLFAGAGGASLGLKQALGRDPTICVNHDSAAIACHAMNTPGAEHYVTDVFEVDPIKAVRGRPVGIFWMSPTCFPAGTLVLTDRGMAPIEQVRVGDRVATHKNRWRRVSHTKQRSAETVSLRGHGHYGLCVTGDHKFYSKRLTKRYPRLPGGKHAPIVRTLVENPYWPEAAKMEGKLWATPMVFPDAAMPTCGGASFSADFFYLVGRWLGDGCFAKGDVRICTGEKDFPAMVQHFADHPLRDSDGVVHPPRLMKKPDCPYLVWGNSRLVEWLRTEFGEFSDAKRLPAWALSMQREWREALLNGYFAADGNVSSGVREIATVSRSLAIGLRLLICSLGMVPTLYRDVRRDSYINGRQIKGGTIYRVKWRATLEREQTFTDTTHRFSAVKEVVETGKVEEVYCLTVEEDESYIADGIVVHNCTHFSSAKGGAPLDYQSARKIRGLAWVGVRWCKAVRPRIVMCENVPGFLSWARLDKKTGRVDKSRIDKQGYGEYFKKWVRQLRSLGYEVEWRVISAADFGAPTIRKRIFIIARCDGLPIVWPKPTHAPASVSEDGLVSAWAKGHGLTQEDLQKLQSHRTTAECIDWSLPSVSIFAGKAEAKKRGVKRPLKDPTLARIAKGVVRFVLATDKPYIVGQQSEPFLATLNHQGEEARGQRLDEPKRTICAARDAVGLVTSEVTRLDAGLDRAAAMIQTGYGERQGQEPRVLDLGRPLGTIMAGGVKHAIVEAGVRGLSSSSVVVSIDNQSSGDGAVRSVDGPLGTIVKENRYALAQASILRGGALMVNNTAHPGASLDSPAPTLTTANHHFITETAFIAQQNLNAVGRPAYEPMATITRTGSQQQLVTAHLTSFYGSNEGATQGDLVQPLGTITAGGFHQGLVTTALSDSDLAGARRVARFLKRYYKPGKKDPALHVNLETGELVVLGRTFQVVDIALRMMAVKELKLAQGFPESYRLDPVCEYRTAKGTKYGPLPLSEQVAKIGNSVCPQVARALAEANLFHERLDRLPLPVPRARSRRTTSQRKAA